MHAGCNLKGAVHLEAQQVQLPFQLGHPRLFQSHAIQEQSPPASTSSSGIDQLTQPQVLAMPADGMEATGFGQGLHQCMTRMADAKGGCRACVQRHSTVN